MYLFCWRFARQTLKTKTLAISMQAEGQRHSTNFESERKTIMRRILTFCAFVTAFSVLAFGETFTGRLIDSACYEQQKNATTCDPTGSTAAFALLISGKAYKLDDVGNTKVAEAIKNRADRAAEPNKAPAQIMARVTGTKEGDSLLKVEAVEVQ
jgi:hypothetical protein